MMNRNEKLEIAKRLRLSTESELSRDDLEQMLDAELSKPEAEMDTELVQQIVDLLEETPSQAQQREAWRKTDNRLKLKQWQPVVSGLTRIAAAGVILVALMFATYGTAQALNWEFLLRLMKPFTETFAVYTGNKPQATPEPEISEVYGDAMIDIEQETFSVLDDCPEDIAGYPAKLAWVPERYTYVQGNSYSDSLMSTISHVYLSEDGVCIFEVKVFADGNDANYYLFEQLPAEEMSENVSGCQVVFYHNTDDATLTASWMIENAHYSITGNISKEEIICIVESLLK